MANNKKTTDATPDFVMGNLSDNITFDCLADENIRIKEEHPMVWFVGKKAVSFSQIEDLYKMAVMRKEQFEERVAKL